MTVETLHPDLAGADLRVGIVQSRFNEPVCLALRDACVGELLALGVLAEDVLVATVPGALEIPFALQKMAVSGQFDALVALGAVIRGETYHFELVSNESAAGIADVALRFEIPVANGVLTTEPTSRRTSARATRAAMRRGSRSRWRTSRAASTTSRPMTKTTTSTPRTTRSECAVSDPTPSSDTKPVGEEGTAEERAAPIARVRAAGSLRMAAVARDRQRQRGCDRCAHPRDAGLRQGRPRTLSRPAPRCDRPRRDAACRDRAAPRPSDRGAVAGRACGAADRRVRDSSHHVEIPYRVIINEAVEVAKSFGGTDGFKYVNGVLDKLGADLRPTESRSRAPR